MLQIVVVVVFISLTVRFSKLVVHGGLFHVTVSKLRRILLIKYERTVFGIGLQFSPNMNLIERGQGE